MEEGFERIESEWATATVRDEHSEDEPRCSGSEIASPKVGRGMKKHRTTQLGSAADECVSNFGTISGFIVLWKGSLPSILAGFKVGRTCWLWSLARKGRISVILSSAALNESERTPNIGLYKFLLFHKNITFRV